MIIQPRQCQDDDVNYAMHHGIDDKIIHCSPTGSGKTIIQALIAKREYARGDSTAILTPREFRRFRIPLHAASIIEIAGPLQNVDGVIHVRVRELHPLAPHNHHPNSHDYH